MCFSLGWLQQLFIYIIVIGAVIAIVRVLLPMVFAQLGGPGATIQQILNIILWAAVAILVVIVAFGLISCLLGAGSFTMLPHR